MQTLHVQLHPDLIPGMDIATLRGVLAGLASNSLVENFESLEGNDQGRYINFNYQSPDHAALWHALSGILHGTNELASLLRASTILACEGSHGWDDYLLLHHFNPSEPLDSASGL